VRVRRQLVAFLVAAALYSNLAAADKWQAKGTLAGKGSATFTVTPRSAADMFNRAKSDFHTANSAELRAAIERLTTNSGSKDLDEKTIENLKLARKAGAILRSSYELFGKRHERPKQFSKFVVDFGHLNDAIANGAKKQVVKEARKTLKHLDEGVFDRELERFQPTSQKSFSRHMAGMLDDAASGIREKKLNIVDFHTIRKNLVTLQDLFVLQPQLLKDPKLAPVAERLESLRDGMGKIHDDAIAKKLDGAIDYDKYNVKVPKRLRRAVLELADAIKH
jgi:hypothetical protein